MGNLGCNSLTQPYLNRGKIPERSLAPTRIPVALPTSFQLGSPEDPQENAAHGKQGFSDKKPPQDGKQRQGNVVVASRDASQIEVQIFGAELPSDMLGTHEGSIGGKVKRSRPDRSPGRRGKERLAAFQTPNFHQ